MPQSNPKKRKQRIETELKGQRQRHARHQPGSKARRQSSKAIVRLRRALARVVAQVKELADRARRRRIDWNGNAPLAGRKVRKLARLVTEDEDCYITSTNGGVHAADSYHYENCALDWGSSDPSNGAEGRLQARMLRRLGASFFLELFGPFDFYVKNGVRYGGQFPAHEDHGHGAAR